MLKNITMTFLALAIGASGAHAAEDITSAQLFDPTIEFKWTTDVAVTKKLVVVGGVNYPGADVTALDDWSWALYAFDAKTGTLIRGHSHNLVGELDIVTSVAAGKKAHCAAGATGDDDGGANAFVICYANKDGTMLWYHEYENPFGDGVSVHFPVGPDATDDARPTVQILNKIVVLRVAYSDGAFEERTSVVVFDMKTGNPL